MRRRDFGYAALLTAVAARIGGEVSRAAARDGSGSDVERWRRLFPILEQRVHGHPLVYLDSAATTQRPRPVIDAIVEFYQRDNANPGAALHELARRAHERYEGARRTVAAFLNAASP